MTKNQNTHSRKQNAVANAVLLTYPYASDSAIGGVLQQEKIGRLRPLVFFSKKLKPNETKYSAFDGELLAIYLSVRHFRYLIEDRELEILTDHKPLIYTKTSKAERSLRQHRYLHHIFQFTTNIRHIRGIENTVADSFQNQHRFCKEEF